MHRIKNIPERELKLTAVRAGGPGGQHVNKVATAIHLRFDVPASSLPPVLKQKLLRLNDHRISRDGIIVIKAQTYRSQEKNRLDAMSRLDALLQQTQKERRPRKPTTPTRASIKRRLDTTHKRGERKRLRGRVSGDE